MGLELIAVYQKPSFERRLAGGFSVTNNNSINWNVPVDFGVNVAMGGHPSTVTMSDNEENRAFTAECG